MTKILLAGCGGGYDIFGGLPLYYNLSKLGHKVILVNYSFTGLQLLEKSSHKITSHLYKVKYNSSLDLQFDYFPEWELSREINEPIYTLTNDPTCDQLNQAYQSIIDLEDQIDRIYLIDGGCDVLLTGIEEGLGTPVEDMMHLKVIDQLPITDKYIFVIGANIDQAHGVNIKNIKNRIQSVHLINSQQWSIDDKSVEFYYNIINHCHPTNTIVHSLIISALDGHLGFYTPEHLKKRISKSTVSLNSQTITGYLFDLNGIANEILYLNLIEKNMTTDEVDSLILEFNNKMRNNY